MKLSFSRKRWFFFTLLAVLILWSYRGTKIDLQALLGAEGRKQIVYFITQLFPPDLSTDLLIKSLRGAGETLAVSFMGTLFAALLAFPFAILSSRAFWFSDLFQTRNDQHPLTRSWRLFVYGGATLFLNLLRSIPEIFWALIFILAVGLGPFPGVLSLAAHNGGVLGKLYSEVLEELPWEPIEALQSTGAHRATLLLYGMLPQAFAQLLSYTLYRWEVNIRAATIIGMVGAGGIGREVYLAISLFHYHDLLTLLIITLLMVTLVDLLSGFLRSRLT
ncbi:MAG: phosphonate ABC transporter, permease protein PhnE [Candidatus Tectomicrobia bacterium]|nr:phosphonate ABC transporter, permease protein PhnE [Candidatus Tectomicrobia bacterium]